MQESHQVQQLQITRKNEGQRIDNFLMRELKGVPRSRVYRLIRRGEVRINKKRCKPETKLAIGDIVRVPPYAGKAFKAPGEISDTLKSYLLENILFEDDSVLVVNKPSGLAVHGGSGIKLGLVEAMRQIRPQWKDIELAHRLDRDTSGCIVLAKTLQALRDLHEQFKSKTVRKTYHALVYGAWPEEVKEVNASLLRDQLDSGERLVRVNKDGKQSLTRFKILDRFDEATLVEASPETGRTHQIRVHCQFMGHPIVGDSRYASRSDPKAHPSVGRVKNLCLHAETLTFKLPDTKQLLTVSADHGMNLRNAIGLIQK